MITPVTCSLYVDGAWVADGSGPDDPAEPVALSGLAVTWGRATTVDQIEPSSASFELLDGPGGSSFLDLLYVGAAVEVRAAGDVPAPATLPINEDPSFEAAPVGSAPAWSLYGSTGIATVVGDRAATGAQSARLSMPSPWSASMGKWFGAYSPPAPFDDLDPAAWDDIPKMFTGEQWAASVAVQPPVGGAFTLTLVGFETPRSITGYGDVPVNAAPPVAVRSDPAVIRWITVRMTDYTIGATNNGQWPGLYLRSEPAAWSTIAPVTAGVPNSIGWADAAGTWDEWGASYLDDVQLLAPASAEMVHRDVVVFAGRITDLDAGWDAGAGGVVSSVVASDFTADLANRDVSAPPWPAERLDARFAHILAGAGLSVPYTIAPTLAGYVVTWMDVDRQQCWPLLADLATSVDGVLWSAAHPSTGPYLFLADPRTQSALYVLEMGPDGLVIITPTSAGAGIIELDSCDVLLDPVVFRQAVSDVSTRVAVTWQEQTLDDAGVPAPTERTETIIDVDLEARLGTRRVAVATELTSSSDAYAVGSAVLGRLHLAGWRVGGLEWRTDASGDVGQPMSGDQIGRLLDLLDGTRRLAAALLLTNLPVWAPTAGADLPLLLQGGSYTFEDGQWTLNLTTSSAAAQGSAVAWNELDPAWAWNEFGPAIDWSDLAGVA